MRPWLLLLVAVLLCGCHTNPPNEIVAAIIGAFAASEAFVARREKIGGVLNYYIRRRIEWLVGATPAWGTEGPNFPSVTQRINTELGQIEQYLDGLLGTIETPGPLGGEADPGNPPHTNLRDVAKVSGTDDQQVVEDRLSQYVLDRRRRVAHIVWRAAAVHHDLWAGSDSALTTTLNTHGVAEFVHRRLRVVERMLYTDMPQGPAKWSILGSSLGWNDGLRVVMFEYPFIELTSDFKAAVAAAGLDVTTLNASFGVTEDGDQLRYLGGPVRIRPEAANNWKLSGKYKVAMDLQGQRASDVFDQLIPSSVPVLPTFQDFWDRNWLFCDHMICVLHVDALKFGLKRRNGSDDEFNGTAANGVFLAPLLGTSDTFAPRPSQLMGDGDTYFEGALISPEDIQVGDHVLFWNNYFMRAVLRTDFGIENALITDVGGEGDLTTLAGHGEANQNYAAFAKHLLGALDARYQAARKTINSFPTSGYIPIPNRRWAYVKWSPYGEDFTSVDESDLKVPGAWWIRIKLKDTETDDARALSMDDALRLFPRSVRVNLPKQNKPVNVPDADSDYQESIYMPLSVPKGVRGGWTQYFFDRDNAIDFSTQVKLEDLKVDASFAPGFFHNGAQSKIPVIRPRLLP